MDDQIDARDGESDSQNPVSFRIQPGSVAFLKAALRDDFLEDDFARNSEGPELLTEAGWRLLLILKFKYGLSLPLEPVMGVVGFHVA